MTMTEATTIEAADETAITIEELMPVSLTSQGDEKFQTVNARDLHTFLEVGRDFTNWIKGRIEEYSFNEYTDFVVFAETGENPLGGRPRQERPSKTAGN